MAGKPVKSALMDALADLPPEDLKRFIRELLARRVQGQPRVPRNKVDGKDFMDVADVVVSTFTEKDAVNVAVEILERINCFDVAKTLVQETGGQTSQSGATDDEKAGGQTSQSASTDNKHFVDKHRVELIKRVSNIESILDDLLAEDVINQETYNKIRSTATPENKMRALYDGPLRAGEACKEIFYKSLEKHQKFLIKDLTGK